MRDIQLIKMLDECYVRRFYCRWLDLSGNVHVGMFAEMPR